jgi:hypothetical protein
MNVAVQLSELSSCHPHLHWRDIRLAMTAVIEERGWKSPVHFELTVQEVPAFDDDVLLLSIEIGRVRRGDLTRLRRTHEPSRLIEFAAIAIAGLGLYHAGRHQLRDLAGRGSGADYLVDEEHYPLEVAGRSRRSELEWAWQQRHQRLTETAGVDFYLCIAEFETPAGRLAFIH